LWACSPVSLAVPERSLAARFDVKTAGWQESALCAFRLRKPCVSTDDETNRAAKEIEDAKKFLQVIEHSAGKPFRDFREEIGRFSFIEETKGEISKGGIIDAKEEKPDSPPGRIAYKIHDCWFVVYSRDKAGLVATDEARALVSRLTIFCKRELSGPLD
jgi:hypothetical protein